MNILDKIINKTRQEFQIDFDAFKAEDFLPNRKPLPVLEKIQREFFLICECKKASPSKGIIRPEYHPEKLAADYQSGGASAISVITEPFFFLGSLADLAKVRQNVELPLLRKDFIIHPQQIAAALEKGADMVLLIASALEKNHYKELLDYALKLGLTPLSEIHNQEELDKILPFNPPLIGINSRNLKDFTVDLQRAFDLRKKIPSDVPVIAESGIKDADDIKNLIDNNFAGALIGESLLRRQNPREGVKILREACYVS